MLKFVCQMHMNESTQFLAKEVNRKTMTHQKPFYQYANIMFSGLKAQNIFLFVLG